MPLINLTVYKASTKYSRDYLGKRARLDKVQEMSDVRFGHVVAPRKRYCVRRFREINERTR